jgi:hypothetical protein
MLLKAVKAVKEAEKIAVAKVITGRQDCAQNRSGDASPGSDSERLAQTGSLEARDHDHQNRYRAVAPTGTPTGVSQL